MRTSNSSGFAVQSRATRNWRAGSPRVSQASISPVAANATTFSMDSTKMISLTEVPPIQAANAWPAIATGPYTDGLVRQSCTARATGSPSLASIAGVVVNGSCPVNAIRP